MVASLPDSVRSVAILLRSAADKLCTQTICIWRLAVHQVLLPSQHQEKSKSSIKSVLFDLLGKKRTPLTVPVFCQLLEWMLLAEQQVLIQSPPEPATSQFSSFSSWQWKCPHQKRRKWLPPLPNLLHLLRHLFHPAWRMDLLKHTLGHTQPHSISILRFSYQRPCTGTHQLVLTPPPLSAQRADAFALSWRVCEPPAQGALPLLLQLQTARSEAIPATRPVQ